MSQLGRETLSQQEGSGVSERGEGLQAEAEVRDSFRERRRAARKAGDRKGIKISTGGGRREERATARRRGDTGDLDV